jgi:hypothetical protein
LWDVDSFEDLTETQRNNMASRLRHVEDTQAAIESIRETPDGADETEYIFSVVNSVELDLMILLSIQNNPDQVSLWQVHSSWTFNTSPSKMLETLPPQFASSLHQTAPAFSAPVEKFVEWAVRMAATLRAVLDAFYAANTVDAALGAFIAIDVCLGQLLVGFSSQRFNSQISR